MTTYCVPKFVFCYCSQMSDLNGSYKSCQDLLIFELESLHFSGKTYLVFYRYQNAELLRDTDSFCSFKRFRRLQDLNCLQASVRIHLSVNSYPFPFPTRALHLSYETCFISWAKSPTYGQQYQHLGFAPGSLFCVSAGDKNFNKSILWISTLFINSCIFSLPMKSKCLCALLLSLMKNISDILQRAETHQFTSSISLLDFKLTSNACQHIFYLQTFPPSSPRVGSEQRNCSPSFCNVPSSGDAPHVSRHPVPKFQLIACFLTHGR